MSYRLVVVHFTFKYYFPIIPLAQDFLPSFYLSFGSNPMSFTLFICLYFILLLVEISLSELTRMKKSTWFIFSTVCISLSYAHLAFYDHRVKKIKSVFPLHSLIFTNFTTLPSRYHTFYDKSKSFSVGMSWTWRTCLCVWDVKKEA